MRHLKIYLLILSVAALTARAADQPLYTANFETNEVGKLPDDFLALDGEFIVKTDGTNKFLELPGTPVDNFGVMFGPTVKEDVMVSARVIGTAKGRRLPAFGVGLGGVTGYRLQMSPSKKALEIFKDQDVRASVPADWKPGIWTMLRLQITKGADGWKIAGKAWPQGEAEPKDWQISFLEKEVMTAGRASLTGSPISGTPVWYDDVVLAQSKSEQLMK